MRKHDPPKDYVLQKGEVPSLATGQRTMRGYSASPFGIQRVEYNIDGGGVAGREAGAPARPRVRVGAVRVSVGCQARQSRADDAGDGQAGNTQPETIPFNAMGILCNVVPRFEVKVG